MVVYEQRFIKIILWHKPHQLRLAIPINSLRNKTYGKTTIRTPNAPSSPLIWLLPSSFGGNWPDALFKIMLAPDLSSSDSSSQGFLLISSAAYYTGHAILGENSPLR